MIIVYEPFLISSINLCTFKLCAFYIFCCLFKSNSYFPFFLFLYIDVASCRFAKLTNSLCELALCLCFLFFFFHTFSVFYFISSFLYFFFLCYYFCLLPQLERLEQFWKKLGNRTFTLFLILRKIIQSFSFKCSDSYRCFVDDFCLI